MLRLDAFVPPEVADEVSATLVGLPGVRHATTGAPTADGMVALSAEAMPSAPTRSSSGSRNWGSSRTT